MTLGNLRNMRQFYLTFSKRDAVRSELSWTYSFPIRETVSLELSLSHCLERVIQALEAQP